MVVLVAVNVVVIVVIFVVMLVDPVFHPIRLESTYFWSDYATKIHEAWFIILIKSHGCLTSYVWHSHGRVAPPTSSHC